MKIDAKFTIEPAGAYSVKLGVRYNLNTASERTFITLTDGKLSVDRLNSTLRPGVDTQSLHSWYYGEERSFDVTILLDRSMLEVYVNGRASATMRIYPHYGDSDYIRLFDDNAGMKITRFKITQMKSAYSEDGSITPPYYGNTGNFA